MLHWIARDVGARLSGARFAGERMATGHHTLDRDAARWRNYIALLARTRITPHLRRQMDESDVVQQTLLEAHAVQADFRGASDAEYGAWLRQILARNLLNAFRDHARDKRDFRRERSLDSELEEAASRAEWLAAEQSSPSCRADRRLESLRLADALATLPLDQRTAVELRHLQGRPLKEIAASMQRSTSAVAGLLHRGLQALRDELCRTAT